MNKIRTIIEKEWAEVFKNRLVLFSVTFLPLLLTAIPIVTLLTTNSFAGEGGAMALSEGDLAFFGDQCLGLNELDCTNVYTLNLFTLLFMILPVMIPVSISAYSIVGEKTTRSLEPLLATPITTAQLLAGKTLAAMIPAVLVTWLSFLLYLLSAWFIVNDTVFSRLLDPMWFVAIFLVGPLLALMAVLIAVMISSRVTDPRVAEQLAGAIVLPIILLLVGQSTGAFLLSQELIWLAGLLVLILDLFLLFFIQRVFERESILTRWK